MCRTAFRFSENGVAGLPVRTAAYATIEDEIQRVTTRIADLRRAASQTEAEHAKLLNNITTVKNAVKNRSREVKRSLDNFR